MFLYHLSEGSALVEANNKDKEAINLINNIILICQKHSHLIENTPFNGIMYFKIFKKAIKILTELLLEFNFVTKRIGK